MNDFFKNIKDRVDTINKELEGLISESDKMQGAMPKLMSQIKNKQEIDIASSVMARFNELKRNKDSEGLNNLFNELKDMMNAG